MGNWTIVATESGVTVTHADGRVMEFTHSDYSDLYGEITDTWNEVRDQRCLPQIRERVARGMEFLDKHYPDHVERVDLDRLNIHRGTVCPLGQAYGEERALKQGYFLPFWAAEKAHPHVSMYDLGFIGDMGSDVYNQVWREAYEARRNG